MSTHDAPGPARIEAVLFDYGLVLTGPPDPLAWQQMQAILEADEPTFTAAYWRFRHDYDRGALTGEAYWHAVAADLRRTLTSSQATSLIDADTTLWTQPNQPMIDWAIRLQKAGIRTGILSNLGDAMETGVLERCSWLRAFAHHTFSHRLGTAKPDLTIYRHAADGLGVPIEAILFIDDRDDNIAGALAAGMQAVQYREHAQFMREFLERGYQSWLPTPEPLATS